MKTKLSFATFIVFLFFSSSVFAVPHTFENLDYESFDTDYGTMTSGNFDSSNTFLARDDMATAFDLTYTESSGSIGGSDSEGGAITGDQYDSNGASTTIGAYSNTTDRSIATNSFSSGANRSSLYTVNLSDGTEYVVTSSTLTLKSRINSSDTTELITTNLVDVVQYDDPKMQHTAKIMRERKRSGPGQSNNNSAAPVPEPATLLLIGTGLASLAAYGIREKRKQKNI